jgi:hypothetical protein
LNGEMRFFAGNMTRRLSIRPRLEVADIFQISGRAYRENHRLTPKQHGVMRDIEQCRTVKFGYHVDVCTNCGHEEHAYNSCRNRHCPRCQGIARRKWVRSRMADLMPIPYYHAVFTLPHKLHPIARYNKGAIYDVLFDAASATLLQFGRDLKHLGPKIGFFGILHTWGGKLWEHFHLHFIVTGGGLTADERWVEPQYKGKFLFLVCALSQVFGGKFIEGLKKLHAAGDLVIPPEMRHLHKPALFEKWLNILVARNWVVYAKRPLPIPEKVVRYIGRYTHKIAISDNRILAVENGKIRFRFRNYRKKGRWEETSLEWDEFIGRFLRHVLPEGFHRIRPYGLLANGRCRALVEKVRTILEASSPVDPEDVKQKRERIECPACAQGIMVPMKIATRFKTIFLRPWCMFGPDVCPG